MELIKKLFAYFFSVDFLLKILIITAIVTLMEGRFNINVTHYGTIGSSYNGFEVKIKQ